MGQSGKFASFHISGLLPPWCQVISTGGRSPRAAKRQVAIIQLGVPSGFTGGPSASTVVGCFRSSAQNGRSMT